jgi:hypothetical protein
MEEKAFWVSVAVVIVIGLYAIAGRIAGWLQ